MPLRLCLPSALVAAIAVLGFTSSARADEKAACVAASTKGQTLRDEGKLLRARDELLLCARDACPDIVRGYCVQWLAEVDKRVASVVIRARGGKGEDLVDVRVSMDGARLVSRLEGRSISVDPGEHAFHFERDGGASLDEKLVIVEGERGRIVSVTFPGPKAPDAPVTIERVSSRPVPVATWVLGGVGLVGIAGFAYFGLTAKSDLDHLRSTCAPTCATSDVDAARSKALVADVSLGVGAVALGLAGYFFFTRAESAGAARTVPQAARADFRIVPGGGVALYGGRF